MREFGLTSRQYNAVKFSLDGMESSIVELRPGRIADLQQRINAADKKLAKLLDLKPSKRKTASKRPARVSRRPLALAWRSCGARAHDVGIEVIEVGAAYKSKIGRQKYARRYGLSGHCAAAVVLARRG